MYPSDALYSLILKGCQPTVKAVQTSRKFGAVRKTISLPSSFAMLRNALGTICQIPLSVTNTSAKIVVQFILGEEGEEEEGQGGSACCFGNY